ncbi:MAG TPA: cyclic peptide export ABC transporter [Pyrinomonadaceae bacterium]
MKVIKFILRNSTGAMVFIAISGIIGGLANAGVIALIHATMNSHGARNPKLLYSYAGMCVLVLASNTLSQIMLLRVSQKIILRMRMTLSRQILKTPLRKVEEAGTPRVLQCLTGDAQTVSAAIINLPLIVVNVATVFACLVYAGFLSRWLLLGMFIFIASGVTSYRLAVKKGLEYQRLARQQADWLITNFRALSDGNKELKLNHARSQEFYTRDLEACAISMSDFTLKGSSIFIVADVWGRMLYFVFIGIMLFILPTFIEISPASLTGYLLIILYIMGPIGMLLNTVPSLTNAKVSLNRIDELGLKLEPDNEEREATPLSDRSGWRRLEIKGVTHSYRREKDDTNFTLGPIDLTLHEGELVFVIGGNGSGKSTFAKIVTGLYLPESGQITLNGKTIDDSTRADYRQLFSAVFSDFYLFRRLPGSYGGGLDEKAKQYLSEFNLDKAVKVEDGILSTTAVSQGQRKRLALLGAYLEDRPFYVFDEWAADQDPFFKSIFYTQMLPELKNRGKTVLVISHDDHYYDLADRVIKLDYGQCVQDEYAAPAVQLASNAHD